MLPISSVASTNVASFQLGIEIDNWQHFHIDNIFIRNIPTALRISAPLRLCVKKETAQLPNLGLIIYRLLIRASDRLLCILTFKSGHKRVTDCLISLFSTPDFGSEIGVLHVCKRPKSEKPYLPTLTFRSKNPEKQGVL